MHPRFRGSTNVKIRLSRRQAYIEYPRVRCIDRVAAMRMMLWNTYACCFSYTMALVELSSSYIHASSVAKPRGPHDLTAVVDMSFLLQPSRQIFVRQCRTMWTWRPGAVLMTTTLMESPALRTSSRHW